MRAIKQFLVITLCALLCVPTAQAQDQQDVQDVQIIIQSQQVRITARSSVVEIQFQVFDQKGEIVYDSGPLSGSELSWALQNASGESVPSGLYAYKLSVKEANAETSALRRGHMIVERGRDRDPQTDRLWVTSQGPVGADASLSGGEITVSSGPETNVVGARIARNLAERGRPQRDTQGRLIAEQDDKPVGLKEGAINISGAGTTNRITKWADGPNGVVGDSTLTEVGGNIGIGTTNPTSGLDYRHTLAPFLTRDIGTTNFGTPQSAIQIGVTNTGSRNVGVGPSFLFFADDSAGQKEFLGRLSAGWENPTNGQEAGFVSFNVRANSADTGALTERMRITSAGNVGIGTTNPQSKLTVQGTGYGLTQTSGAVTLSTFITNATGGSAWFGTRSNHPLNFFTNDGLPQMTIDTNGNVGIGASPVAKLHVLNTTGGTSAVYGESATGPGVYGKSTSSRGVYGESASFIGVWGKSTSHRGVFGESSTMEGVYGFSVSGSGVYGESAVSSLTAAGVYGKGTGSGSIGVIGESNFDNAVGVFGVSASPGGFGGYFRNTGGGKSFIAEGTGSIGVLEIIGGSDLAEKFEVNDETRPGMVVAIDPRNAGRLSVSRGAYNRRVAGIISGANNLSAGMVLPNLAKAGDALTLPVALSGRVWVYCDATRYAIHPGDLLTTSATPGHAMKVANHARAQGAIIGKAMTELKAGKGLVLALVTLQ